MAFFYNPVDGTTVVVSNCPTAETVVTISTKETNLGFENGCGKDDKESAQKQQHEETHPKNT